MILFFKTRGRPLVVLAFTLSALLGFWLSTSAACALFGTWQGAVGGGVLLALAFVCHLFGSKAAACYVIGFVLNTAAMGCFASAYYNSSGVISALQALLPAMLIPACVAIVACVVFAVFPRIKLPLLAAWAVTVLGILIADIVLWVQNGGTYYAFMLFSLLIVCFQLAVCAVTVGQPDRELLRDISFGGFGMLTAVAIAVLVAVACLSDGGDCGDCGDCCDCCDCSSGGSSDKRSKKKKRP